MSLAEPRGAWAAVLYWALLASFALGAAMPHRRAVVAGPSEPQSPVTDLEGALHDRDQIALVHAPRGGGATARSAVGVSLSVTRSGTRRRRGWSKPTNSPAPDGSRPHDSAPRSVKITNGRRADHTADTPSTAGLALEPPDEEDQ
jgi:hypothetical protein